jgi:hypothetical protein
VNGHFGRLALAILFAAMLASHASAETVAQTTRDWGLIGTWSRDCSLPPGREKIVAFSYEIVTGDQVMHRRDFGDSRDENPVVAAVVSADGMLNLSVFFPAFKQTRQFGLMRQDDGTMRTIYNHDEKDEYSIRDGIFTANGNPTPPLHKCR